MEIKYRPSTLSGVVSYLLLCFLLVVVFLFRFCFSPEIFLKLAKEINYFLRLGQH